MSKLQLLLVLCILGASASIAHADDVYSPVHMSSYYMDLTPTSSGCLTLHLESSNANEPFMMYLYYWEGGRWKLIKRSGRPTDQSGVYKKEHWTPYGIWKAGSYKLVVNFNGSVVRSQTVQFDIVDSTPSTPGPNVPYPEIAPMPPFLRTAPTKFLCEIDSLK